MRDFTKRRNKGDIVRRFCIGVSMIILLTFVCFGAVRASWGMYGKFAEAATANAAAQQNLTQMTAQEQSVSAEVAELQSPVGQEAQLRQSYGVALPGEGEIQIVRETATSSSQSSDNAGNFVVRIFRALFSW